MRKIGWTALILLATGGIIASMSGPFSQSETVAATRNAGAPLSTPPSGDGSLPDASDLAATRPLADHGRHEPIHAPHTPESDLEPAAGEAFDLDRAEPGVVRRTLLAAIDREQQARTLYVSPGIVDAVAERGSVRVIFETGAGLSADQIHSLLAGSGGAAAVDALRVFPLLDQGAATVGPQALLHLVHFDGTAHIELDVVHEPSLDETIALIGGDLAHQQGHDGDGFAVAVLDTGVEVGHPMLAGRVIEEACFSLAFGCPNGQLQMFGPGAAAPCGLGGCGHGTHVSGVAVGRDVGAGLVGAAPNASLIAIQIFSDVGGEPGAYTSDILAGLQHVLALTAFHSIAAVNLSFGSGPQPNVADCDQDSPSQLAAVGLLAAAGVVTTAAAGNEFLTNAITSPACLSNVIGVGSVADDGQVSDFSNSALFLSLLAPGEFVESAAVGGGTGFRSGTSMAAPHVAGAIAAIREAAPAASAAEVSNALALSGVPVVDPRNGVTTPRISVPAAIAMLQSAGATVSPVSGTSAGGGAPSGNGGGGGGGSSCGLLGIEPFLVLGLVRLGQRLPGRRGRGRLRRPACE